MVVSLSISFSDVIFSVCVGVFKQVGFQWLVGNTEGACLSISSHTHTHTHTHIHTHAFFLSLFLSLSTHTHSHTHSLKGVLLRHAYVVRGVTP